MGTATLNRAPPQMRTANGNGAKKFTRSKGVQQHAFRAMIYGTGGIGKTSLAMALKDALFADLESGTDSLNVERAEGIEDWNDLRAWLQTGDFEGVKSIVIDSVTRAEDMCREWVIGNIRTEKGESVKSIEAFGWGKGYVHMAETWKLLLNDLEQHYRQGRNVILIAHERTGRVPNPMGEDYIRYEPRLMDTKQASIMYMTKEWCDHVLHIGYDIAVSKGGLAQGGKSRSIYPVESPYRMAKSRSLRMESLLFTPDSREVWDLIEGAGSQPPTDDAPPM